MTRDASLIAVFAAEAGEPTPTWHTPIHPAPSENIMDRPARLTQRQRRAVDCPVCGARPGRPCQSTRIGSPSSLGGGWGGYPVLDREHPSRVADAREVAQ